MHAVISASLSRSPRPCAHQDPALTKTLRSPRPCAHQDPALTKTLRSPRPCAHQDPALTKTLRSPRPCAHQDTVFGESGTHVHNHSAATRALCIVAAMAIPAAIHSLMASDSGLGLKDGVVDLVEHDPRWGSLYHEAAKEIVVALDDEKARVEHIGPTSVSGLLAKPVLDIAVGMPGEVQLPGAMVSATMWIPRSLGCWLQQRRTARRIHRLRHVCLAVPHALPHR